MSSPHHLVVGDCLEDRGIRVYKGTAAETWANELIKYSPPCFFVRVYSLPVRGRIGMFALKAYPLAYPGFPIMSAVPGQAEISDPTPAIQVVYNPAGPSDVARWRKFFMSIMIVMKSKPNLL